MSSSLVMMLFSTSFFTTPIPTLAISRVVIKWVISFVKHSLESLVSIILAPVSFHSYEVDGRGLSDDFLMTDTILGMTPPLLVILRMAPGPISLSTIKRALFPVMLDMVTPDSLIGVIFTTGTRILSFDTFHEMVSTMASFVSSSVFSLKAKL